MNASYLYSQELRVYISVYYIYISVCIRAYISGDRMMIIARGVGWLQQDTFFQTQ